MPVAKAFSIPLPAESQLQWRALIAWLALVHAELQDIDARLQVLET